MAPPKHNFSGRIGAVVVFMGLAAAAILGRLFQLQVIDHTYYAAEARQTRLHEETVTSRRGAILDQNGYPLAVSVDTYDIMVEKRAWNDPAKALATATEITAIAGGDAAGMVATVTGNAAFETSVARGLNYEQAAKLRQAGLPGIRLKESSHRVYPEGSLAAQLIGFLGQDQQGLTGLEADLDATFSGSKGELVTERDGLGNALFFGERTETAPQPGSDVVLTIDRYLQRLAETELTSAIKQHEAQGGSIVIVDAKTGAIRAMASQPSFDLTNPELSDESKLGLFRNRAVTDQYEPGSIFKLVTAAAALDTGVVSPNTSWYDAGYFAVGGWRIYNWDFSANGSQTVTQAIAKSLNTGAAWLSSQVGASGFYDYVRRFGFGEISNIGLSGEAAGSVRTPEGDPGWSEVDLATNSFGQGITATPLQVAMAVAAIANDGKLMKPFVVDRIVGQSGVQKTAPQVVRQAVSPETARSVLDMMGIVASSISGSILNIPNHTVGGKTGTANIAKGDGTYKPDAYISSFVGVLPLEDPTLVILVKIDEPKGVPWGTTVAAPAFNNIAKAAITYYNIPPDKEAE